MGRPIIATIAFTVIFISGCTSGKKALEQGNYSQAVLQSVERLRSSPDHKKSVQTLKQAYPLAIQTYSQEIDQLLRSNDPLKYSGIVDRYETMNRLADEIRHCPAALSIIRDPQTFGEQLAASRLKAAPEAYNKGMELLHLGNREKAKEAYYHFLDADRFVPGYEEVKQMIEQARFEATLKVLVEQIPVPGRYKISSDFFYDQVYSFLQSGLKNEFVRFYTPDEAGEIKYVDEILVMEFDDFVVGATNEKESEKEYTSKDSVKVGTATINGQKVDVFNRVKAKLTTHRREVISTGLLNLRIIESRGEKARLSQKIPGTFTWVSEWAHYNGDERALTPQQLELCKRKPAIPPAPQELFLEFTKPIYEQIKVHLRNYYKNF